MLPKKISVSELVQGRYPSGNKPLSWNDRYSGVDVVKDASGSEYKLESSGDQSAPQKGWQILLTETGSAPGTYKWTLYGIS